MVWMMCVLDRINIVLDPSIIVLDTINIESIRPPQPPAQLTTSNKTTENTTRDITPLRTTRIIRWQESLLFYTMKSNNRDTIPLGTTSPYEQHLRLHTKTEDRFRTPSRATLENINRKQQQLQHSTTINIDIWDGRSSFHTTQPSANQQRTDRRASFH